MEIGRYAFFVLAILTAGLAGSALHGMLSGNERAPVQVFFQTTQTPTGISAGNRDTDSIEFNIDGRQNPTGSALTIAIKLSNEPAPLTKTAFCADVNRRGPLAEAYASEWQIKGSPPSLSPQGAKICAVQSLFSGPLESANQPFEYAAWPTDKISQIILAKEGSIVFVGSNGSFTANTGSTAASGSIALGVKDSALTTGTSAMPVTNVNCKMSDLTEACASAGGAVDLVPVRRDDPEPLLGPSIERREIVNAGPHANSSFLGALPKDAGVAISGFEDHSVSVTGSNQIVTYDDSNVVINRNGQVNANTGDTDSSGLNVVDATDSRVRSGNSGDAEGNDDEDEDKKKPKKSRDEVPGQQTEFTFPTPAVDTQVASEITKTTEDDSEEPNDKEISAPEVQKGQSFGTVTDEGTSAAIGTNAFVVGADGFDDVSIRSSGDHHLVTYDDSNLVIGGTGKVNAQIGDSDTGGTVVMGVHNSDIEAGCEGDLCYSGVEKHSGP